MWDQSEDLGYRAFCDHIMKHVVLGLALVLVAHHSIKPVNAMTIEAGQEEDPDYAIRGSIMTDKDEKEESNRKARLFWGVS